VSSLSVVARNTAFTFKGQSVEATRLAQQLGVSHVLEGSVRKSGDRVRITAQLIDGAAGRHIWAERYDRDLTDIFTLQDEISEAIVSALKLRLLPEEKAAIERRGTASSKAYDLYLMARQHLTTANHGDFRVAEAIVDLCRRATQVDPGFARAWALMAMAQTTLHFASGKPDDGLAAAERALLLDPDLAEAHAVRAKHLFRLGRLEEAASEIDVALRLDPESYEVNSSAALQSVRQRRWKDAIGHYEKASALMARGFVAPGMLMSCYSAISDDAGLRRAAKMTLRRAEDALAQDPANGSAMGFAISALAALGEAEQARERSRRALLLDPGNMSMRYNLACSLSAYLNDESGALELLGPYFAQANLNDVFFAKVDPELARLHEDRDFQAMIAGAETRLAAAP
ncbi:MAG: tetratricopeptide repeat protein, partial [Caulobacteraceae bacterium]